jgi:hypothetical protein
MGFRFSLDTRAAPAEVFRAFTDFSDRRLVVWKKSLDPKKYELRELGDGFAVVREGSAPLNIWVVLRYEWTEPASITWTLLESNHCDSGWGDIRITAATDGGSHVDVEIDQSEPRGVTGRTILLAQQALGPVLFPRMWKSSLDHLAAQGQWP